MHITLTCPHCSFQQHLDAPNDSCLAMVTCVHCEKSIKAEARNGECTCVICEFSDSSCPIEEK